MLVPGATTCGRIEPSHGLGPRLLLVAITQVPAPPLVFRLPVPQARGALAGGPTVPAPGPLLPVEKSGKMPAFTQFCTAVLYVASQPLPPQLLFDTRGRRSGRGSSVPPTRVGAIVH